MSGTMDMTARTRNYFSKPGFSRLLQAIWRRYAGLEKLGGYAVVRNASMDECETINLFMGWSEKPGFTIRVSLLQFEQELEQSVFACSITELHEVLIGEPLLTKSERKLLAEQSMQHFFTAVEREVKIAGVELVPAVKLWLEKIRNGTTGTGYRMVRDLWSQSAKLAECELINAARAWNMLLMDRGQDEKAIRLPVLASLATGNPHALDRNMPAGRLLFQGLRFNQARQAGEQLDTEERILDDYGSTVDSLRTREIYRTAGILDDDLSSLVHLYEPEQGRVSCPYVMTLRQVESVFELPAISDIYVVENPAVFSTLVDCLEAFFDTNRDINPSVNRESGHLLMCTSGPASAAALRLLDRYAQEAKWSGKLYYSGDFDIKGIEIGNVLAGRYPQLFVPWRFDSESYLRGLTSLRFGSVRFTDDELARLVDTKAAWDATLSSTLLEYGSKLFQEQLIPLLNGDWEYANRQSC